MLLCSNTVHYTRKGGACKDFLQYFREIFNEFIGMPLREFVTFGARGA